MENAPAVYKRHYSERRFWKKSKALFDKAKSASAEVIAKALLLYYVAEDPRVSWRLKGTILGALGYFILSLDAVPDFSPVMGFADDVVVLTAAIAWLTQRLSPGVVDEAREKADILIKRWQGDKPSDQS